MRFNRIAPAQALGHTVRGLGVCDALQLELLPVQRARLASAIEALPLRPATDPLGLYERRLVGLLREGLPSSDAAEPFVFVGPAAMLGHIVRVSARDAVQELRELAAGGLPRRPAERARLEASAAAAAAWIRTFLDWLDVESFSFDPDADPALPW